jgi:hypothetical protein
MGTKGTVIIFTPLSTISLVSPPYSRIPFVDVDCLHNECWPPCVPSEGPPFITIEAHLPLVSWMRWSSRYLCEHCSKTETHPCRWGSAPATRGLAKTIDESRVREGARSRVAPPNCSPSMIGPSVMGQSNVAIRGGRWAKVCSSRSGPATPLVILTDAEPLFLGLLWCLMGCMIVGSGSCFLVDQRHSHCCWFFKMCASYLPWLRMVDAYK